MSSQLRCMKHCGVTSYIPTTEVFLVAGVPIQGKIDRSPSAGIEIRSSKDVKMGLKCTVLLLRYACIYRPNGITFLSSLEVIVKVSNIHFCIFFPDNRRDRKVASVDF